jgi:hypothetical protein
MCVLTDCRACLAAAFLAEKGFVVEERPGGWWQGPWWLGRCAEEREEINDENEEAA